MANAASNSEKLIDCVLSYLSFQVKYTAKCTAQTLATGRISFIDCVLGPSPSIAVYFQLVSAYYKEPSTNIFFSTAKVVHPILWFVELDNPQFMTGSSCQMVPRSHDQVVSLRQSLVAIQELFLSSCYLLKDVWHCSKTLETATSFYPDLLKVYFCLS